MRATELSKRCVEALYEIKRGEEFDFPKYIKSQLIPETRFFSVIVFENKIT